MPREIFGNKLPPIEESKNSDIFHNIITNGTYVFDNGEWEVVPETPEPSLPEPTIADAGKAIVVGEDGKYELGEGGGGTGGGALIVHIDGEALDKTYKEIVDAISNGQVVLIYSGANPTGSEDDALLIENVYEIAYYDEVGYTVKMARNDDIYATNTIDGYPTFYSAPN